MTCKRIRDGLIEYLDGDIMPDRRRMAISEHLETCADCRAQAAALEQAETALRALAATETAPELTADLRHRMATPARPGLAWVWAVAGIGAALAAALAMLLLRSQAPTTPAISRSVPPRVVAEAPKAQAPRRALGVPRVVKARRIQRRSPRRHVLRRWHHAATAAPEQPQPEAAPIEVQPPEPAPVELAQAPVGVVLLIGAAQKMPAVSSYHVEVSFPDGAKSLLEQDVERDASGRPRTIQVACRERAPADAAPNQGGVE